MESFLIPKCQLHAVPLNRKVKVYRHIPIKNLKRTLLSAGDGKFNAKEVEIPV